MTEERKRITGEIKCRELSRRDFIKTAGVGLAATGLGAGIIIPARARASKKQLRIVQWQHKDPTFDDWFKLYAKNWGEKNNTEVKVENHRCCEVHLAVSEANAREGHDILMFRWSPAAFENYAIDHREIHEECERKYGRPLEMAIKSTYNPKTKKYFGFSPGYMPVFISYRKDLWDDVGYFPGSWEDVRVGGRKILEKHGKPIGIGLDHTDYALNGIMYSFGSSVQDEAGNLVLNSKETIEVVRYVKDLYQGPIDKVFIFRGQDYHRDSMVSGKLSLTFETNIVSRTAEKRVPEMSSKIQLAKSPAGPVRRLGSNQMATYLIWKFSENIEGAKKFLVDYVGNFQEAFLASGFLYFPCHPKSVPDMERLLKDDPRGHPSTKYRVLEDVAEWTTNLGYPGYANAAMAEIFDSGVVSKMFRNFVAEYVPTAEKAVEQAEEDCKRIFTRWREKGLV